MRNLHKLFASIAIATVFMSAQAQAAFTTTNWKSNGDGFATLDQSTGLEWLDISRTAFWTPGQVLSAMNTGGSLAGWRLPTPSEVTTMMNNWFAQSWSGFGITHYSGYPSSVINFYNTFGVTRAIGESSNGHRWGVGFYFNGTTMSGAGVYHRNSWGDQSGQAWVNDPTSYTAASGAMDGAGMFLVSDGGLTLSSKNDPSLNVANPNSPYNQRPAGGSSITDLKTGTSFASIELAYGGVSNFVGYKYKVNGGAEQSVVGNKLNITGLTEGTQYTIDYAAYNNSGTGDWYSTTAVTQVSAPLMAMSGLLMLVMGLRRKSKH